jgi:hypothetical protein
MFATGSALTIFQRTTAKAATAAMRKALAGPASGSARSPAQRGSRKMPAYFFIIEVKVLMSKGDYLTEDMRFQGVILES